MTESIFLLRCVDCDARGALSRLWLRTSIEVTCSRSSEVHHYVECMNCGAHLKSRQTDRMEDVDDAEWSRFVGDAVDAEPGLPSGMLRIA